ncbi:alcohol dehydrogenase [Coccidioides immitis H538.4]|uniref:Alcohol dehydrogenase n=1 Tax=Coccidioides immitis H538.4 TaxID=396776 RepID=A0A0J8ULZ6_COCIT|nr:alcohol dehydrogenase [Coccidioides immitis H538.4]
MDTMQPTGASEELIPPTMPAVYLPTHRYVKHRKPGPSNLVYRADFPTPTPTETQYLIKVQAAAVCRGELEWPHLLHRRETGAVIAHDICGTVLSTPFTDEHLRDGPKFKVGDRVFGLIEPSRDGGAADCVAAEEDELAFKPQNISAVEAASIPLPALMAYQGLFEQLRVNDWLKEVHGVHKPLRLLILNGASSVGIHAIQMLRSKSLLPSASICIFATTNSKQQSSFLRDKFHVDEVIDCAENPDLVEAWVQKGWAPVHLVLDCIGGKAHRQAHDEKIICKNGAITTTVGAESEVREASKNQHPHSQFVSIEPNGKHLEIIGKLVEKGELTPYVDKVFELHEVKEAMTFVEAGELRGRVVLHINYD